MLNTNPPTIFVLLHRLMSDRGHFFKMTAKVTIFFLRPHFLIQIRLCHMSFLRFSGSRNSNFNVKLTHKQWLILYTNEMQHFTTLKLFPKVVTSTFLINCKLKRLICNSIRSDSEAK